RQACLSVIGNHNIEMAVTIKICHRNCHRDRAYSIALRCAKSPIWISEKDICRAWVASPTRHHIGNPVSVKIGYRQIGRKDSRGEKRRSKKAGDLGLNRYRREKREAKQKRQFAGPSHFPR